MKNQSLLYVMNQNTPDEALRAVLADAQPNNTRVVCLVLSLLPEQPINAYGYFPYDGGGMVRAWNRTVEETQKNLKDAGERAEALLSEEGVSGDVHPVHCAMSDISTLITQRAMVADFATVAPNLREDEPEMFKSIVHSVLFRSPAGLVLNGAPAKPPKQVFVAWNADLPCGQAVHKALPLLKAAEAVRIAVIDPKFTDGTDGQDPGADVARWLSHHGCNVTVTQYPGGGGDVAATLMRRAKESGADLMVMGAFGRPKTWEVVFGGTTQSMLEQTDLPVLMVH